MKGFEPSNAAPGVDSRDLRPAAGMDVVTRKILLRPLEANWGESMPGCAHPPLEDFCVSLISDRISLTAPGKAPRKLSPSPSGHLTIGTLAPGAHSRSPAAVGGHAVADAEALHQLGFGQSSMKWNALENEPSSLCRALSVVGDRWTLLILDQCFQGVRRFTDFCETLGITRAILTERLNKLVRLGVLQKTAGSSSSAYKEYVLTQKGLDLHPVVIALAQWGDGHMANGRGETKS